MSYSRLAANAQVGVAAAASFEPSPETWDERGATSSAVYPRPEMSPFLREPHADTVRGLFREGTTAASAKDVATTSVITAATLRLSCSLYRKARHAREFRNEEVQHILPYPNSANKIVQHEPHLYVDTLSL